MRALLRPFLAAAANERKAATLRTSAHMYRYKRAARNNGPGGGGGGVLVLLKVAASFASVRTNVVRLYVCAHVPVPVDLV